MRKEGGRKERGRKEGGRKEGGRKEGGRAEGRGSETKVWLFACPQGKTVYQAEIDATCESIDFLRFAVHYSSQLLKARNLN